VFRDHVPMPTVVRAVAALDVVCVMRERTPLTRSVIDRLPNLKLICSTAPAQCPIDLAARRREASRWPTRLCILRHDRTHVATDLVAPVNHHRERFGSGRLAGNGGRGHGDETLGIIASATWVSKVASGSQPSMDVIAWSQNLTAEKAAARACDGFQRTNYWRESDIVSIHLILSRRNDGLIGAAELAC